MGIPQVRLGFSAADDHPGCNISDEVDIPPRGECRYLVEFASGQPASVEVASAHPVAIIVCEDDDYESWESGKSWLAPDCEIVSAVCDGSSEPIGFRALRPVLPVALVLAPFVVTEAGLFAQDLGQAPQVNVAVQEWTGEPREGAWVNLINIIRVSRPFIFLRSREGNWEFSTRAITTGGAGLLRGRMLATEPPEKRVMRCPHGSGSAGPGSD
jgi:hypothetical protein